MDAKVRYLRNSIPPPTVLLAPVLSFSVASSFRLAHPLPPPHFNFAFQYITPSTSLSFLRFIKIGG